MRDGRLVSSTSRSFARLLDDAREGPDSFRRFGCGCSSSWWGSRAGVRTALTGSSPTSSVSPDAGDSPDAVNGASPDAPRLAVCATGAAVEAPRAGGGRWSQRKAVGAVDPASPDPSRWPAAGVRQRGKCHCAGRQPTRGPSRRSQTPLDPALPRVSPRRYEPDSRQRFDPIASREEVRDMTTESEEPAAVAEETAEVRRGRRRRTSGRGDR